MTPRRRIRGIGALVGSLVLVVGCSAEMPSGSPAAPSPTAGALATPSASPSDVETPAPATPSAGPVDPSRSPVGPLGLRVDWVAETLVDRVRMRSLPSTGDESERYEPLLGRGERVFVVDGPVEASGYIWYQVLSLIDAEVPLRSGWVAVASREGEQWLRDVDLRCPERATLFENFAGLADLRSPAALACYGSQELLFLANVASCGCTVMGPALTPAWLASVDRTTYRLSAPEWLAPATRDIMPAFDPAEFADPELSEPDLPPTVYQVWGHYDHEAAAMCRVDPDVGSDPVAQIGACRMTFVITQIRPFEGIDEG